MANFLKSLFVKGVEIDTTGASTGNVLSYNGTKFAPTAPGSGSLALDDLSDVVITSPEEFQGISYNGTSWVNGYIPLVSYVRNAESTTITTGTCVYLYGSTGDHATVKRADNTSDTTSSKTIGVVGASITASNNGPVITRGYVDGIDLSTGYSAGDVLWLGTNGAFTKTKPTAPDHLVFIGVVVRATNNGIIYVATQNGYELDEIHNVSLPSPQSGEFLKYNGSLWVADAIDLGTDTTGNYVASLVAGTGISLANNTGEGATPTITNTGVTSINTTLTGAVTGIVTTADTGTVTSTMIADGTIVNGDINASAGITLSKLASGTSGQVVIANGSGVPTYTTISGDITISSTGVATIAANSVALGTDTTGNYMAGTSASTGIVVSHTPGEGSTATIAVDTAYSGFSPIGTVQMYAGSTAPTGWAICDGAELAIASYGALYAIIGTRYGALTNGAGGVGSTHFKLPSFSSRVPKGLTTGTPTVPTTAATNAAASVDTHTHGVNSTFTAGGYNHTFSAGSVNSTFTAGSVNSSFTAGNATAHTHALSGNVATESTLHYHFWNGNVTTGGQNVDHSHGYFKPNSGTNTNTGNTNTGHTHNFNLTVGTGFQLASDGNANAYHNHPLTNTANLTGANAANAANTTTTVNSTFTAGNVNSSFTAGNTNSSFTAGNVNSSFTAGNASTINSSTPAHTHTTDAVDIVFIIRVS